MHPYSSVMTEQQIRKIIGKYNGEMMAIWCQESDRSFTAESFPGKDNTVLKNQTEKNRWRSYRHQLPTTASFVLRHSVDFTRNMSEECGFVRDRSISSSSLSCLTTYWLDIVCTGNSSSSSVLTDRAIIRHADKMPASVRKTTITTTAASRKTDLSRLVCKPGSFCFLSAKKSSSFEGASS